MSIAGPAILRLFNANNLHQGSTAVSCRLVEFCLPFRRPTMKEFDNAAV
jgi:hypothetical protein